MAIDGFAFKALAPTFRAGEILVQFAAGVSTDVRQDTLAMASATIRGEAVETLAGDIANANEPSLVRMTLGLGVAVEPYSGGMVQRLGLAVAVLPAAPVFLLDESTAALDPDGLAAFYSIVERHAAEGRTVLFTSHQLGDVERLADRFVVLVAGRLVAVLTQRELHDRLSARGTMRVRTASVPAGVHEQVRAVAPGAHVDAGEIVIPGPPSLRPAALDACRLAGVDIRGLTTEEGRIDAFYRELIGEAS